MKGVSRIPPTHFRFRSLGVWPPPLNFHLYISVRTHDGHFLSHTPDGRITFDADYSNDTPFAERKRRGSGFSVTEEEGSGGRKQKGNAFQQDGQGVLCNENGEPVMFEEGERRYGLKVEKFGPVEVGFSKAWREWTKFTKGGDSIKKCTTRCQ